MTPTYSESAFKSQLKRLEDEDPKAAIEIEDQFDEVQSIFKEIRRDLRRYELGTPKGELARYLDELLTPGTREIRGMAVGGIASLPQQQAPNAQQQAPNAMQNFGQRFNLGMSKTGQPILPTGLTRVETALLRPYEQAMRLRERGLA